MAAAQIMSASRVPIPERLRSIASSSHWRHVYRIATSKIFSVADLTTLRGDVLGICHALDNGDFGEVYRVVKSGPQLAIDLLADGVASSTPRYKKALLRRAMTLLDNGPGSIDFRLANFFDADTYDIFEDEISSCLALGTKTSAFWRVPFVGVSIKNKCGVGREQVAGVLAA